MVLVDERLHQAVLIVGIDGKEDDIAIIEALLHLLIKRVLGAAWATPGGPEIEHQHLPAQGGESELASLQISEREVHGIGHLGIGIGLTERKAPRREQRTSAVVSLKNEIAQPSLRAVCALVKLAHFAAILGTVGIFGTRVRDGEGIGIVPDGLARFSCGGKRSSKLTGGFLRRENVEAALRKLYPVFETAKFYTSLGFEHQSTAEAMIQFVLAVGRSLTLRRLGLGHGFDQLLEMLGIVKRAFDARLVTGRDQHTGNIVENLQVIGVVDKNALAV